MFVRSFVRSFVPSVCLFVYYLFIAEICLSLKIARSEEDDDKIVRDPVTASDDFLHVNAAQRLPDDLTFEFVDKWGRGIRKKDINPSADGNDDIAKIIFNLDKDTDIFQENTFNPTKHLPTRKFNSDNKWTGEISNNNIHPNSGGKGTMKNSITKLKNVMDIKNSVIFEENAFDLMKKLNSDNEWGREASKDGYYPNSNSKGDIEEGIEQIMNIMNNEISDVFLKNIFDPRHFPSRNLDSNNKDDIEESIGRIVNIPEVFDPVRHFPTEESESDYKLDLDLRNNNMHSKSNDKGDIEESTNIPELFDQIRHFPTKESESDNKLDFESSKNVHSIFIGKRNKEEPIAKIMGVMNNRNSANSVPNTFHSSKISNSAMPKVQNNVNKKGWKVLKKVHEHPHGFAHSKVTNLGFEDDSGLQLDNGKFIRKRNPPGEINMLSSVGTSYNLKRDSLKTEGQDDSRFYVESQNAIPNKGYIENFPAKKLIPSSRDEENKLNKGFKWNDERQYKKKLDFPSTEILFRDYILLTKTSELLKSVQDSNAKSSYGVPDSSVQNTLEDISLPILTDVISHLHGGDNGVDEDNLSDFGKTHKNSSNVSHLTTEKNCKCMKRETKHINNNNSIVSNTTDFIVFPKMNENRPKLKTIPDHIAKSSYRVPNSSLQNTIKDITLSYLIDIGSNLQGDDKEIDKDNLNDFGKTRKNSSNVSRRTAEKNCECMRCETKCINSNNSVVLNTTNVNDHLTLTRGRGVLNDSRLITQILKEFPSYENANMSNGHTNIMSEKHARNDSHIQHLKNHDSHKMDANVSNLSNNPTKTFSVKNDTVIKYVNRRRRSLVDNMKNLTRDNEIDEDFGETHKNSSNVSHRTAGKNCRTAEKNCECVRCETKCINNNNSVVLNTTDVNGDLTLTKARGVLNDSHLIIQILKESPFYQNSNRSIGPINNTSEKQIRNDSHLQHLTYHNDSHKIDANLSKNPSKMFSVKNDTIIKYFNRRRRSFVDKVKNFTHDKNYSDVSAKIPNFTDGFVTENKYENGSYSQTTPTSFDNYTKEIPEINMSQYELWKITKDQDSPLLQEYKAFALKADPNHSEEVNFDDSLRKIEFMTETPQDHEDKERDYGMRERNDVKDESVSKYYYTITLPTVFGEYFKLYIFVRGVA